MVRRRNLRSGRPVRGASGAPRAAYRRTPVLARAVLRTSRLELSIAAVEAPLVMERTPEREKARKPYAKPVAKRVHIKPEEAALGG